MNVVEVISNETIKPSSPTPHHLRDFNLSILDQLAPPSYIPIILFYSGEGNGDAVINSYEVSERLKKSLSEALARFYPVAGRLKNNTIIDCNDDGVEYIETRVLKGSVSDFMTPDLLHHLLPKTLESKSVNSDPQLIVQVNKFDGGGTAICLCVSHKVADATTMSTFINSWAATARGAPMVVTPTFDSVPLFPPREGVVGPFIDREKDVVTKRFVFDASNLAALRAKIFLGETSNDDNVRKKYPTRVEAVSALIWQIAAKAAAASSSPKHTSVVKHPVNMRPRMDPPLPEQSFGNLIALSTTPPLTIHNTSNANPDVMIELNDLVGPIRDGISMINSDYLKQMQGDEGFSRFRECLQEVLDGFNEEVVNAYIITSWCRLPFYEADFGWGKPTWVSTCYQPYKNIIVLMSTKGGDGIEAYVSLVKEDMFFFESDPELLSLVSLHN